MPYSNLNTHKPGEKVLTFSSARLGDSQRVSPNEPYQAKLDNLDLSSAMINEPSSFESLDSKSRMLLINLPLGKIDNEPEETF